MARKPRCKPGKDLPIYTESRLAKSEWDTVAQLAIQIKDHASERGADRIFQRLLADRRHRTAKAAGNILAFLGRCTAFAEPAPATTRDLAARTFAHALIDTNDDQLVAPLAWLMVSAQGDLRNHVACELEARVAALVESDDSIDHILGLRLALQLHNAPFVIQRYDEAWNEWDISSRYERQLMLAANFAEDVTVFTCLNGKEAGSILARRSDLPQVSPDIYRSAAYILCVFAEFSKGCLLSAPHIGNAGRAAVASADRSWSRTLRRILLPEQADWLARRCAGTGTGTGR